jgi:hypothetical protein
LMMSTYIKPAVVAILWCQLSRHASWDGRATDHPASKLWRLEGIWTNVAGKQSLNIV